MGTRQSKASQIAGIVQNISLTKLVHDTPAVGTEMDTRLVLLRDHDDDQSGRASHD